MTPIVQKSRVQGAVAPWRGSGQSPEYYSLNRPFLKKCLFAAAGGLCLVCLLFSLLFGLAWRITPDPLPALLARPSSPALLDSKGSLISVRLSSRQEWRLPVPLAEMGEWLPKVLVAVEDKRFYSHPGVDVLALGRAVVQNLMAGKTLSGASTISSQLVRLSTPRPRTLYSKVLEFIGALKLERSLSKDQILEHYLNSAPFGGPIHGVEAAARIYFGKKAGELSLGEAALLVGMLKGPTAYRPDRNPAAALKRRQSIIRQMARKTNLAPHLTALALEEALPGPPAAMPDFARHFADLAFDGLPRSGGLVASRLSQDLQLELQAGLRKALKGAGPGVTAAGLVIDNRDASIIAYVGNALFDPLKNRHWVDCALAPRSPGSTLKPFVYIMAMDAGRIIPDSLLADTPLDLSGEAPRNFDRRYQGPVSARTALANSLNAPAVRVLRMVGVTQALYALRNMGFAHLDRPDEDYGDSLVLGAGEVSLLELARAYSSLARLGEDRALGLGPAQGAELTAREPAAPDYAPGARFCSPAAAYLASDMLRDSKRLPFLQRMTKARDKAPAAFKTGTSFGLRDAWTVAYSPKYTVALWFGKEGGGSDLRLVGLNLAAPTALDLLGRLEPDPVWPPPPPDCGRTEVCALSGAAPSPFCPAVKTALNIPAVWPTRPCALHVQKDGKARLEWPPELEDFNRQRFAKEDLSRQALIVSPMPGARYLITPGARQMPLALKAEGVSYPVHWYVDGMHLGAQQKADQPLYWLPKGGEHRVSLLDAKQRVGSARLTITDLTGDSADLPLGE